MKPGGVRRVLWDMYSSRRSPSLVRIVVIRLVGETSTTTLKSVNRGKGWGLLPTKSQGLGWERGSEWERVTAPEYSVTDRTGGYEKLIPKPELVYGCHWSVVVWGARVLSRSRGTTWVERVIMMREEMMIRKAGRT